MVANAGWYHQSAHVGLFAQHLQEIQNEEDLETIAISNFPPGVLGSQNPPLIPFLKLWARPHRYARDYSRPRINAPSILKINHLAEAKARRVEYDHLLGDKCDFQGIDWEDLGVTRREARERRLNMYKNFVNIAASDDFGVCSSARVSAVFDETKKLTTMLYAGVPERINGTALQRGPSLLSIPKNGHAAERPSCAFPTTQRPSQHG
jgi:hypothetical protein